MTSFHTSVTLGTGSVTGPDTRSRAIVLDATAGESQAPPHTYMLIALVIPLMVSDALPLHAENFAGLGAGRYFHFHFSLERRHIDFRAESSLHETNRNIADNIKIVANENRMRFHLNDNVEVTGRATRQPALAFAAQLEARTIVAATA